MHNDLQFNPTPNDPQPSTITKITIPCYFPNNYSGVYDNNTFNDNNNKVSSMKYLLMGVASGIVHEENWDTQDWRPMESSTLNTKQNVGQNDGNCNGYAMGNGTTNMNGVNSDGAPNKYLLIQQSPRFTSGNKNNKMTAVKNCGWLYRVDYNESFTWPKGDEIYKNTIDQVSTKKIRKITQDYDYNAKPQTSENDNEKYFSFLQFCCAIMKIYEKQTQLLSYLQTKHSQYLSDAEDSDFKKLLDILKDVKDSKQKIKSVTSIGYSSVQQKGTKTGNTRNEKLAQQRAEMLKSLFESSGINFNVDIKIESNPSMGADDKDENGQNETLNRKAELVIEFETETSENVEETSITDLTTAQQRLDKHNEEYKYVGYKNTGKKVDINGKQYYLYEELGSMNFDKNKKGSRLWYNEKDWIGRKAEQDEYFKISKEYDENNQSSGEMNYDLENIDCTSDASPTFWRLYDDEIIKSGKYAGAKLKERKDEKNNLRYDQEYYFFKKLEATDKITYKKLVEKLQYFDPAFHSMTPEGFNGRLTFLNQCMRQGNTLVSVENKTSQATARNLAFGRPPFCVLRIGDFYNQTIIIENLSINYDFDGGIHWDLNNEGIGVQPLLAQVQLSIKFIGGGDMSGPIRRLQNAMSFNYYANTSLYDNRTDRYVYEYDSKTAQNGEIKTEETWVYDANSKAEIKFIDQNLNLNAKQWMQMGVDKAFNFVTSLSMNKPNKDKSTTFDITSYENNKVSKGSWDFLTDKHME